MNNKKSQKPMSKSCKELFLNLCYTHRNRIAGSTRAFCRQTH